MPLQLTLRSPQLPHCRLNLASPQPTTQEIINAIREHDLAQLQIFLNSRPSFEGFLPLHLCVEVKFDQAIPALLKAGVNPNQVDSLGRTALLWAMERKNLGAFRLLYLHTDVSILDRRSIRPLNLALMNPVLYKDQLKELIWRTDDLNVGDCDGNTPLHYTYLKLSNPSALTSSLQQEARDSLLKQGVNPRQKNNFGRLPSQVNFKRFTDLNTKVIGHINSLINFGSREYESAQSSVLIDRLTKMDSFKYLPQEIQVATESLPGLCENADLQDFERLAQKVARSCLVIFPIQTKNHISYAVFFRGYLALCDRANQNGSLDVYSIDRRRLNAHTFQQLSSFEHQDDQNIHAYLRDTFLPNHGAKKTNECEILEELQAKSAKAGTCTYNNLKLAWRIAMAFSLFKKGYSSKYATEQAWKSSKRLSSRFRKESIAKSLDEQAVQMALDKLRKRPPLRV